MRFHGGTLFGRQQAEALLGRCRVAAPRHGEHLRRIRVGQVRQQRHVQLVPLLEADFVHAHVSDQPHRVDPLVILQLVLDDQFHGLRRDAQPRGHLFFVAADEHPQHVLLEAVAVHHLLPLERREVLLAMPATRAAMETGLKDEKARLTPEIEVADHVDRVLVLIGGGLFVPALLAPTGVRQWKLHLEAMPIA